MKKLLIVFLVSFLLMSCATGEAGSVTRTGNTNYFEYSIVHIEGMPCLVVSSYTYNAHSVESITCDWSKWEGE